MDIRDSVLNFSKFQGTPLKDLPLQILKWLVKSNSFIDSTNDFKETIRTLVIEKTALEEAILPKAPIKYVRPTIRMTSSNVSHMLYAQLYKANINCVVDYRYKHNTFDMIVLDPTDTIVAIVEIKNRNSVLQSDPDRFKQTFSISSYGIPVFYCSKMGQVADIQSRIVKLLNPDS